MSSSAVDEHQLRATLPTVRGEPAPVIHHRKPCPQREEEAGWRPVRLNGAIALLDKRPGFVEKRPYADEKLEERLG
jgi:hypothetical protein